MYLLYKVEGKYPVHFTNLIDIDNFQMTHTVNSLLQPALVYNPQLELYPHFTKEGTK